jgi:hypothetical protein
MKKLFVILFMVLTTSGLVARDFYVKTNNHTDAITLGDQSRPASDNFSEQWIGNGKMSVITPTQTIIIDLKKKIVYLILPKTKTYIQTNFPLNYENLLPPELAPLIQNMKRSVVVTPTGKNKTIAGKVCDEYSVAITFMQQKLDSKIYATADVPFNLKKYIKEYKNALSAMQFIGMDEASIKEMDKIKGFQMGSETISETFGAKIHTVSETVEIAPKTAPAGTYTVPDGYTKQDKLSTQDMQSMGGQ